MASQTVARAVNTNEQRTEKQTVASTQTKVNEQHANSKFIRHHRDFFSSAKKRKKNMHLSTFI